MQRPIMHYNMTIPREHPVARLPGAPPGPAKLKSKSAHGQFDPDELSRRLCIVLAEQKAHAERKRRARAEGARHKETTGSGYNHSEAGSSALPPHSVHSLERGPEEAGVDLISELRRSKSTKRHAGRHNDASAGHSGRIGEPYVPQQAATQFALTTTVEPMQGGLVHKLSKRAMRFHMDGVKTNRTHTGDLTLAPHEQERALRSEQKRRDRVLDRNQFQHTRILETTAEVDERKRDEEGSRHRHTFEGELMRLRSPSNEFNGAERRSSTGDLLERAEINRRSVADPSMDTVPEDSTPPDEPERYPAHEHRVDWTQSDEIKQRPRLLLTPLLRKADSIWTLRSRLGSKGSQDKAEPPQEHTLKSPKSSFFARLRR